MRIGPDIVVDEISQPYGDPPECAACSGEAEFRVDFVDSWERVYLCQRHMLHLHDSISAFLIKVHLHCEEDH